MEGQDASAKIRAKSRKPRAEVAAIFNGHSSTRAFLIKAVLIEIMETFEPSYVVSILALTYAVVMNLKQGLVLECGIW